MDLSQPVAEVLGDEAVAAARALYEATGYDALRSPLLWEHVLSAQCMGELTAPGCRHDVLVDGWLEVEVKFASEIRMGDQRVFRWAQLASGKTAPVTVLYGLSVQSRVSAWVLPRSAIGDTNTTTVTVPEARVGRSRTTLEGYEVVPDDLLGAVLRYGREAA